MANTVKSIEVTPRRLRFPPDNYHAPIVVLNDGEYNGVVKLLGELGKLEDGGGEVSSSALAGATGLRPVRVQSIMADLGAARIVASRFGYKTKAFPRAGKRDVYYRPHGSPDPRPESA